MSEIERHIHDFHRNWNCCAELNWMAWNWMQKYCLYFDKNRFDGGNFFFRLVFIVKSLILSHFQRGNDKHFLNILFEMELSMQLAKINWYANQIICTIPFIFKNSILIVPNITFVSHFNQFNNDYRTKIIFALAHAFWN